MTQLTVYQALAAAMADIRAVEKSDLHKGPGAPTFNFRGVDRVVNAVGPVFRDRQILALPQALDYTSSQYTTKGGSVMRCVVVRMRYTFVGPAGDTSIPVEVFGEASDTGDKAMSKAESVALRVALLQTLMLPTQERDADADAHERATQEVPVDEPREATEADQARSQVAAAMQRAELDPTQVVTAYYRQHKVDLRDDDQPARLLAFAAALRHDPDAALAAGNPRAVKDVS